MLSDLRSLSTLLFPVSCIGCGAVEHEICPSCWQLWRSQPVHSYIDTLPLAFTARYQPKVQRFILAAKEEGSKSARNALAQSLSASLSYLMMKLDLPRVHLVPIPSSRATIRTRGRDHSLLLAKSIAQRSNQKVEIAPILRVARKVADQSGLTHLERATNLAGAFTADSQLLTGKVGAALVIVDDVITSGASVREGVRALAQAGLQPVAAISACASARFLPIRLPLAKPGPSRTGSEFTKEDLWSRY